MRVGMRMGMHSAGSVEMPMGMHQIGAGQQVLIAQQFRRRAGRRHLAVLQDEAIIGDIFHESQIVRGGHDRFACHRPSR